MQRRIPVLMVAVVLLAGSCGGDDDATRPDTSPEATVMWPPAPEPNPDKPEIALPSGSPTDLVITILDEGSGRSAEEGDTVVVDYVGVRSEDGTEFDNSYDGDRQPLILTLGSGEVISGWEQGLVGARAGSRLQLDIPAELAYGDNGAGDVILPGDALSFVLDVRLVIAPPDPADTPEVDLEPSTGSTDVATRDIVLGTGPALAQGDIAFFHLMMVRGDTLEVLENTWVSGGPIRVVMDDTLVLAGFYQGLLGQTVGSLRLITLPYDLAFGEEGDTLFGLPEGTDVLLVVELVGAF